MGIDKSPIFGYAANQGQGNGCGHMGKWYLELRIYLQSVPGNKRGEIYYQPSLS